MTKKVVYADPGFKQQLHDWMQVCNPKPQGEELKKLLKKCQDERLTYIERQKKSGDKWADSE